MTEHDKRLLGKISAEANKKARARDLETEINLDAVAREEAKANAKANAKGLYIGRRKEVNKAPFSQIMSENVQYLIQRGYLTTAEQAMLFALSTWIEMHSNVLVKPKENDVYEGQVASISDIARGFGYSINNVSRVVNRLINKGVIYELIDALTLKKYGRTVKERTLIVNPEIIFAGNRNCINATLCRLHLNADHIEKAGIKLPWKVWLKAGTESGKLYRRVTFLKLKNESKKKRNIL